MRTNVAVILAGGVGSRLGLDIPKQFLKVAGKTIIEHTIDTFQSNSKVDEIVVVIHPVYVDVIESMVITNKWDKVKKILKGGNERYESSLAAINAYSHNSLVNLIFHDAVRPLVSQRIIDDVIEALKEYDAIDTAIPAVDTIVAVNKENNNISNIPDRRYLRRGQTPQAFKIDVIRSAYEKALLDPDFSVTDDCGIIVKYLPNKPVYIINGEESNVKLTHIEDVFLLDKLFQLRSQQINQIVPLNMLKDKVIVVFGGNSGIGEDIVKIADEHGARSYSLSRSQNGIDIKSKEDVDRALAKIYNIEGRIDYVVNSAALLLKEPLINMSYESITDVINTNYLGMINVSISSFEYLKETSGQLLHFTSSSYTRGRAFYSLYSSSKAAVVNFVQAIAQEWEPFNIRVNCINPERTKTQMRITNFGIEPDDTLLKSSTVAEISLQSLLSSFTGQVVDVKLTDINLD
jgi:2-C-methyl-D-erythritol 4-phosphate cytidylyltransferase